MKEALLAMAKDLLHPDVWREMAVSGGLVVGAMLVAYFVHRLVYTSAGKMAGRTSGITDNALVEYSRRPARAILMVFALFLVIPNLGIPAETIASVRHLLTLALTAAVGWLAIGMTGVITEVITARYDITAADNLEARQMHTRARVIRRVLVAVIMVITASIMLMSIPSIRQIGVTLFASAGVAGLVIGMAARPALSNLIAGLQLAMTQPIRIDDVVIVENEWGWIEEISSTFVVVRIWDLRRLVVPLSYFLEHPFQNWTRKTSDILGTVFLYADYTVPVGSVREELHRVLQTSDLWDQKVWGLQVTDAKENTVELRALMSAATSGRAWDLRCYVREAMLDFLQREYPESLPRVRAELDRRGELSGKGGGSAIS
jgi:small-conductance mechanosensitive channel